MPCLSWSDLTIETAPCLQIEDASRTSLTKGENRYVKVHLSSLLGEG